MPRETDAPSLVPTGVPTTRPHQDGVDETSPAPREGAAPSANPVLRRHHGGPGLTRDTKGWRFQIRIPRDLRSAHVHLRGQGLSFASTHTTLVRVRLGPRPASEAKSIAARMSMACHMIFDEARRRREEGCKMSEGYRPEDLGTTIVEACQSLMSSLVREPRRAMHVAAELKSVLGALDLVATTSASANPAFPTIHETSDAITRQALARVLSLAQFDPARAATALSGDMPRPEPERASHVPQPPAESQKLFSELLEDYINVRKAAGLKQSDESSIRLRCRTWIEIVGDKAVGAYSGNDAQAYVTAMSKWPANVTKRTQSEWTVKSVLEANADLTAKPIALKTLTDGYIAHIKAVMATAGDVKTPFQRVRKLVYGKAHPASAERRVPPPEVVARFFRLCVESGMLATALLPLLAATTARRIGQLAMMRGCDLDERDGHWKAKIPDVINVGGRWVAVADKTDDARREFVLHQIFQDIGFSQWAQSRGNNFIFEELHTHIDPADVISKRLNKLLKKAGAKGNNIEVIHSFRHDGIDNLREITPEKVRRIQSGHTIKNIDEHEKYGKNYIDLENTERIATMRLTVGWGLHVYRGLDFDAMAAKRSTRGRNRK